MFRILRLPTLGGLLLSLVLIGAKCIENETLYRDKDGDWHIVGEIYNETDVQGTGIALRGALLDANGNELAVAEAPTCPTELSPGSLSIFDIEFNGSGAIQQPASYRINVIRGRAQSEHLPPLNVSLSGLNAERNGDTVTLTGHVRANEAYPGVYYGCAALYNTAGQVMREWRIVELGALPANYDQPMKLDFVDNPQDVTAVRFWLVGPGPAMHESSYRALVSDFVPIH